MTFFVQLPILIVKSIQLNFFDKVNVWANFVICVQIGAIVCTALGFTMKGFKICQGIIDQRVATLFHTVGDSLHSQMQQLLLEEREINITVNLHPHEEIFGESGMSSNECALCLDTYVNSDVIVRLPCDTLRHFFHSRCIAVWLKQKLQCPLCRRTVAQISTDYDPTVTLLIT